MDIKTCRYCKKTFRGFGALCPACAAAMDDRYVAIRNFLDKNRYANISIVAEGTGIEEKAILYLIREGRIALRGDSAGVTCLKCGSPIPSGKYCDKCKGNLARDLEVVKSAMAEDPVPDEQKAGRQADGKSRIQILKDK